MRILRVRGRVKGAAVVVALLVLTVAMAGLPGTAADHLDAPGLSFPAGRGDLDINDVYAFQGAKARNTVLALTVGPAAGALSPATFGKGVLYEINIDSNLDGVEDIAYRFRFSASFNRKGHQFVTIRKALGAKAIKKTGAGRLIGTGVTNRNMRLTGGGKAYTGLRSDPFFFDLDGFLGTVEGVANGRGLGDGMATDPFATFNTLGIVLEVPDTHLGGTIGVWAATYLRSAKMFVQVDRMGRPAINTVVNSSGPVVGADPAATTVFNEAHPSDDVADFTDGVVAALLAFSSLDSEGPYAVAEAEALAGVLLPDMLVYDTSTVAAGPLNGRNLADDVIDTELRIVTGGDPLGLFPGRDADGGVNSDGIGPHTDYLTRFPYLGKPH